MPMAVFLAIYNLLTDTGLYFLIHVGVCKPNQQAVGPRLVYKSQSGHYGLVMVCVVESADMLLLLAVYSPGSEVLDR